MVLFSGVVNIFMFLTTGIFNSLLEQKRLKTWDSTASLTTYLREIFGTQQNPLSKTQSDMEV